MISVVICSINPVLAASIDRHYQVLFGNEPHEVVLIRDARSLAEGYNRGLDRATGDIVVFSHDDIEFLDPASWLARLKTHLARFEVVGLAGTTRLSSASWAQAGPPYTFGQVSELGTGKVPFQVLICGVPAPVVPGIQAIDGLFFAAGRNVLERVRFDEETFDGFHCYDVDFSYSAYLAGFQVAVACDLPVLHASQGNFDEKWEHYAKRFMEKHAAHLSPSRPRPFQHAMVGAQNKAEILEILNAPRTWWSQSVNEADTKKIDKALRKSRWKVW